MKAQFLHQNQLVTHDDLLDKDEWLASDVGLPPDVTHSIYSMKFTKITTPWLHQIVLLEGWLDWPEKPIVYNSDLMDATFHYYFNGNWAPNQ